MVVVFAVCAPVFFLPQNHEQNHEALRVKDSEVRISPKQRRPSHTRTRTTHTTHTQHAANARQQWGIAPLASLGAPLGAPLGLVAHPGLARGKTRHKLVGVVAACLVRTRVLVQIRHEFHPAHLVDRVGVRDAEVGQRARAVAHALEAAVGCGRFNGSVIEHDAFLGRQLGHEADEGAEGAAVHHLLLQVGEPLAHVGKSRGGASLDVECRCV